MTRQMADRYAERLGEPYVGQVTAKIEEIVRRFRRADADRDGTAEDAHEVYSALAEAFDEIDFAALEQGLAEVMFQAGCAGAAATPFGTAADTAGDTE